MGKRTAHTQKTVRRGALVKKIMKTPTPASTHTWANAGRYARHPSLGGICTLQRRDQIFCSTGGIDGHQKSFLPTPAGTARIQHAYLNPAYEQKRRRLQHGKSAEPGMAHHKPPFYNQAALRGQGCAVLKQRKAVILLQKFTHMQRPTQ